jgi:uncharacterized membrane protein YeaQ/YmgE (transglycosylase-associated protein family)
MSLIYLLIVGAIAGWLAGLVMKGRGFGLIGNIILGIIGAVVGNYLLGTVLGVSLGGGDVGTILTASIGAVVLLGIIGLVKKA